MFTLSVSLNRAMLEYGSISCWIEKLKAGDQHAAQKLWERYCRRLVGLARKKLGDSPRGVKDEDDVVQSVFKSFCLRTADGQFPDLRDRDSLWPLLAIITARKAANQRLHERRAKRGGGRIARQLLASVNDSEDSGFIAAISDEPTPEDIAIFRSEVDRMMNSLDDPSHRLIMLWKLEERTNSEIALKLKCSLSAVERKWRVIRKCLSRQISGTDDSSL
jgi:RNA polymerase sigma factor (sigma-70 family)